MSNTDKSLMSELNERTRGMAAVDNHSEANKVFYDNIAHEFDDVHFAKERAERFELCTLEDFHDDID
jgi:hypothetical protein